MLPACLLAAIRLVSVQEDTPGQLLLNALGAWQELGLPAHYHLTLTTVKVARTWGEAHLASGDSLGLTPLFLIENHDETSGLAACLKRTLRICTSAGDSTSKLGLECNEDDFEIADGGTWVVQTDRPFRDSPSYEMLVTDDLSLTHYPRNARVQLRDKRRAIMPYSISMLLGPLPVTAADTMTFDLSRAQVSVGDAGPSTLDFVVQFPLPYDGQRVVRSRCRASDYMPLELQVRAVRSGALAQLSFFDVSQSLNGSVFPTGVTVVQFSPEFIPISDWRIQLMDREPSCSGFARRLSAETLLIDQRTAPFEYIIEQVLWPPEVKAALRPCGPSGAVSSSVFDAPATDAEDRPGMKLKTVLVVLGGVGILVGLAWRLRRVGKSS